MRRIFAFFINLQFLLIIAVPRLNAQDTIIYPLKIKVGLEVSGPVIYAIEKNNLIAEGYISADFTEKYAAVLNAGYADYSYSQYNYEYLTNGIFVRAGIDINLLNPKKSMGKYWVGTGFRYGISHFTSEVPGFAKETYYGTVISAVEPRTDWVHFLEFSPGVRGEVFNNFSIGWTISVRMLLFSTTSKDLRPIYVPGFGNSAKILSAGMSYFICWNIPYKKRRVIIRKEEPEEPEDTENTGTSGTRQQGSGIRQ
jgi:hypothetical protein